MRPRVTRAQLLAGLLCAVLGFALVVQARQTQTQGLASLRQSDLLGILDNISERSARLDDEARRLQETRDRLESGAGRSAAAEQAARDRLEVLGILAGTAPASGPGIVLRINDPQGRVTAAVLLDTLQELRDAGAEALQINSVRVVASTAFVDGTGGVQVDGTLLQPPYTFVVIGDPQTLTAALQIPGGVLEVLRQQSATGTVHTDQNLLVDALRTVRTPQYAHTAPAGTP
jgi:uncharacterized protein YlxW (UPF0749 family)